MKIRKLADQQLDFLSTDHDHQQWKRLNAASRNQTEHLIALLMLSIVVQPPGTAEDCDVQN